MKTFKRIIALSLLAVLLCSTAAFANIAYRCRNCGKVAEGDWGKATAGVCDDRHFFHDWEITVFSSNSDYQGQLKETEYKKLQELQEQLEMGHNQG